MSALVSARACSDYAACGPAVDAVLDALGGLGPLHGRRVLLKVNLMYGTPPARAITTHPAVVRAVVRAVQRAGGRPCIAESSGIIGFTGEAFGPTGMAAVAEETGAPLCNLDRGPFRRLPVHDAGGLDHILVSEAVLAAELRISIPKLKTHDLTGMTGALKNQFGLLPGGTKCAVHTRADTPARLARAVVAINRAVPFDLAVCDGIVGLHGGSNNSGRPVDVGVVAASRDLVALDAVCAVLFGLEGVDVATTRLAAAAGLGTADLGAVRLAGLPLAPRLRAAPAGWNSKRLAPVARVAYRLRGTIVRPEVQPGACTGCGDCVAVCPVDAIAGGPPARIGAACVHCFACQLACPEGAIKLRARRGLGATLRQKAAPLRLADLL